MAIEVDILGDGDEVEYEEFLKGVPNALIYATIKYRNFLKRTLSGSTDLYLVARDNGAIVGALPTFLSSKGPWGPLLNSLPFFGSHGGILTAGSAGNEAIEFALIAGYHNLEECHGVAASTLIESPLCPLSDPAREYLRPSHEDARVGQFTALPQCRDRSLIENAILAACHQKTRNAIRKAMKLTLRIEIDASQAALEWLHREHARGITELGGVAKPLTVLEELVRNFRQDGGVRIYRAFVDDEPAAALLLLYFGKTVEYFTPVVTQEHRNTQVLSALVLHSMVDAALNGCDRWNWGGTWLSQEGVYRFKSRWGATDFPYRYHIRVLSEEILHVPSLHLRERYPFFYAFPYSATKAPPYA